MFLIYTIAIQSEYISAFWKNESSLFLIEKKIIRKHKKNVAYFDQLGSTLIFDLNERPLNFRILRNLIHTHSIQFMNTEL